jgi:6-phosphofructokinase 1
MSTDTLAILVGGGPAPGLNGVIASATQTACAHGLRVIGLYDGYRHIANGDIGHVRELTADDVANIHGTGGSILRTSRTNPARDEETLQRCTDSLARLGVRYLVCIGGDDTTYGATQIAARTRGTIGVATVPKTIDNDLPLPGGAPTFGYETARALGSELVENLVEDARTTGRWYLCVSMGRTAGSLALGIGRSSGAALTVIPEELTGDDRLQLVADIITGAIVKRVASGRRDGVAIVAEGIAEHLTAGDLALLEGVPRDTYGQVRLADIPIGTTLRDVIRKRLTAIGVEADIVPKDIGYELRCARPIAFDVAYTRALGAAAVRYVLDGGSGALIALVDGVATPLALDDLRDPQSGRIRVRRVDVASESYRSARAAMTRLEREDLVEPQLTRLARATSLAPDAFATMFARAAQTGS